MITVISLVMFALGLMAVMLLVKLFCRSLKVFWKLALNALAGALTLLLLNIVGSAFGLTIPIDAVSSLIVGALGVPGVVLLVVWHFIL